MSDLTRSRLVALFLAAAFLAPIAYALFVQHGLFVRLWGLAALVAIWAIQFARDRAARHRPATGDPARGLILFVEPLSWLGLKWGYRRFLLAARLAATPARRELFSWSDPWRATLLLPDLLARRRHQARAKRLAAYLSAYRAAFPDAPIDIIAYSSGGFIALEALRQLNPAVRVRRLILLACSVSRDYDLSVPLRSCDRLLNLSSPLDFLINGLGPLLLGTNDRRHVLPAGLLGFRPAADQPACHEIRWRPRFTRFGWLGDHFSVAATPLLLALLRDDSAFHR